MKLLKSEHQYAYDDFRKLQCGICKKKLWDAGRETTTSLKLRCPLCGIVYSFEPIRWRVLAEIPPE